jgi:hypothetical protein
MAMPVSGLVVGFRSFLLGGLVMVRIVFVARFLKMVLQLLFRVAAALAHGSYLLGCGRCVGVQMRAMIRQVIILGHSGIVPPDTDIRKWLSMQASLLLG